MPSLKKLMSSELATVAQLAEQLICNQQVVGSNPISGSIIITKKKEKVC